MTRAAKTTYADIKRVLILCVLILTVVSGASFLIYHEGAKRLRVGAEIHQRHETSIARAGTEGMIRSLIENMELLARQPMMIELLDGDVDHEITDLLETTHEKNASYAELCCISPEGKVLVSTNTDQVNEQFDPPSAALTKLRGGLRAEIRQIEKNVIVEVPIFWQFDERECLGVLRAKVDIDGFLVQQLDWWVALTTASGRVLAHRGGFNPEMIDLDSKEQPYADNGRVIINHARLKYPAGVFGPEWTVVVADTEDELFGEIWVLGRITGGMAIGSAIAVVILILGFSGRQRALIQQLQERGQALEDNTVALESSNLALKEAKIAAEAATVAKSEFLANMSHEIRTPMTSILGFSETLSENIVKPENRDAITTITRNGQHLLDIINDILDLSKIEAGKTTVEQIPCSPCALVSEAASLMRVRTDAKGLTLEVTYYSGPIPETIQSDPVRIRQILINLIGNAVKFTKTGGIRVITSFVNDAGEPRIQFDIVDTGIGMTESQASRLFQPFSQADTSMARKFGGTGLGLVISKRFAEMLGGDIVLVETREGSGTRFRVTIATGPLEGVKMLENPGAEPIAPVAVAQPSASALSQTLDCRILLAEDGLDNQRLIKHILSKAGADVSVVENGKLALDAVLATLEGSDGGPGIDLILMDMQMPVMDGYLATAEIRKKGWDGPIIALTAHAMAGDREKCLAVGCDDYATKPIHRKLLIELINRHLASKAEPAVVN
ncbi:MAG: ATP-binding protein [Phycisphaerae bacterium]